MDKNKTFLIDFDHTLFNVNEFVRDRDLGKLKEYKNYLYPDVLEFILYAKRHGKAVLFSEGEHGFQNEKIEKSGVKELFGKDVEIYPSLTKVAGIRNYGTKDKILVIDDKPEVIDNVLEMGYKAIRVKRGKYAEKECSLVPTAEVDNLSEIIRQDLFSKI